ncbi:MAG: PAS domain S-box protein, partial [Gammaproteobacteria bacterium]|nr:PAS domain S-box protein [Gammaproteobacteria bacterium]
KPLYSNSDKLVDEASKFSAMLMQQEEDALLKSWKTIIVLLILSSIVFLGLAGFLSRQVKKQVYELTNSEQRFQDVVFSTGDWIWEVDAQGLYTFASERIKDILGYSSKEVIGKSPFEMMAEGEAERVGPVFIEQLTNKKPLVDLENWNIAKDGSRVCLLTSGVPMLDDGGNLLGYRGVDKDITERKIAEEELKHHRDHLSEMVEEQTRELRSSEEKTRNILTTAAEGIITIDQRGIITSINPAAEQLFAYSAEEIIGKNISKLMPEKIASQHDAILESYIKSGVSDIMGRSREMLGLRKTGETFPMRLAISETQYDDEIIFTGFIHDLTDEKHFEKQLAEKSRLLEESNTEERTLSNLLRVALQTTNMKEFLNEILNTIFKDIYWLGLEPTGAIFLTTNEGKGQSLHLSVEYNLSEELHSLCARIPFGRCLCGRAATERTIQFAH